MELKCVLGFRRKSLGQRKMAKAKLAKLFLGRSAGIDLMRKDFDAQGLVRARIRRVTYQSSLKESGLRVQPLAHKRRS